MREIVLDTETTGLSPGEGHRVVEIGCLELSHHMPTGASFHTYINPERAMPDGAFRIHGLSDTFLGDKPLFASVAQEFLDFIGEVPLIIHNAAFDMAFINAELARLDMPPLNMSRTVDTVALARAKFPGARVSLDDLCRRFEIDLSGREKHGALLDAELLALVYLELIGGRQPGLELAAARTGGGAADGADRPVRPARPHAPSEAELAAHEKLIDSLAEPLWRA
ncbi:MAG: DNA polymerase III subunit epsilon [Alphaproteobacteria bacterium]|nr:DNA polymerase III subunit epsilon [Alphaproteobacteria bacterium]